MVPILDAEVAAFRSVLSRSEVGGTRGGAKSSLLRTWAVDPQSPLPTRGLFKVLQFHRDEVECGRQWSQPLRHGCHSPEDQNTSVCSLCPPCHIFLPFCICCHCML